MNSQITNFEIIKEKVLVEEMRSTLKIISSLMAIPLFLVFWIADLILYPEEKWNFLAVRLLIIPICYLAIHYTKRIKTYNEAQVVGSIYACAVASLINFLILMVGDVTTPYYAGLNLVAIGGIAFIPFNKRFITLTAAGIYLPYFANIFINVSVTNLLTYKLLVPNLFFIVSSAIICGLIRHFNGQLRSKDLDSQNALALELASREVIIQRQTEEATKLHQLSSQFSPQVVQAIKKGDIAIEKQVQKTKICAVFIDIVRSTDKVNKLPEKDIQLVLERFLDTCLTTLLKYDLTIDKFHGDGILAYSNVPIAYVDFIERTCMATLEALEGIKADREFYIKHWQSPLEIRAGISVGYANVGFYGNKKYFKTYTAIGSPLPHASRLTSLAEPNQIYVDHEIHNHLSSLDFVLKSCGAKALKGFEGESMVYELISSPNSVIRNQDVKTCPTHPNSVLYLDTNTEGHFVFKCRDCGYEDSQMDTKTSTKAS